MTEKNAKSKPAKGRNSGGAKRAARADASTDQSVLGSLPSTRPTRMSRRRASAPASASTATATPAKPRTAAKPKSRPTAAKPRAAAKPRTTAKADGPRAVRSGSPSLERPAPSRARRGRPSAPPKGTELVTTAVQAAGELAQIGFTIGGRMVKRAVGRLPKP